MKDKYDPPMSLVNIKKIHGLETYNKLIKDPVHKWRAETGIELIHKEPNIEEQKRIWKNWNLMTSSQKAKSDSMSMKIFGMTNKEHYNKIMRESNNFTTESTFLDGVVFK